MIEELYHSAGCMHILYQNSLSMFDIMEFGTEEQKQQAVDHYMETGWPIASPGPSPSRALALTMAP